MKIFAGKAREIMKIRDKPKTRKKRGESHTTNVLQRGGGIIRTCEKERECGDG